MKKYVLTLIVFSIICSPAWAFLYDDVKFMTKEEITQLADEDLFEIYVNTKVIEKASQEFHISAGFSNKREYDKRRKLIRLLFDLRMEIDKRETMSADTVDKNMR